MRAVFLAFVAFSFSLPSHGVVNGVETGDYPWVQARRKGPEVRCTGSAVSDTTLITAHHCLEGIRQKSVSDENLDLAVVIFPPGTFSSHVELSPRAPAPNAEIVIVGYGRTSLTDDSPPDGRKRMGRNRLLGFANRAGKMLTHSAAAGDYLHFRSPLEARDRPGVNSMTAQGDSGGPILIGGKLAGVVAFGGARRDLVSMGYSFGNDPSPADAVYEYDVNLHAPAARRLLSRAVRELGAKISGFPLPRMR